MCENCDCNELEKKPLSEIVSCDCGCDDECLECTCDD